jgi:outer membrane protein assembly factor BamE (lipoprotein component of BamABCDE complex)
VLVGTLFSFAIASLAYEARSAEGLGGLLLRLVLKEDTNFAEHYSESKFADLRPGQTARSVEDAIGKPLRVSTADDGEVVWQFSESPTDTHFRNRQVRFSSDAGVVTETFAEFYID